MKRLTTLLVIAAALFMVSCIKDNPGLCDTDGGGMAAKEIEIAISTGPSGAPASRAEIDGETEDPGIARENIIETLDLLIFDAATGKYLYRREAVKLSASSDNRTSVWRASLLEHDGKLDVHILANSRGLMMEVDGMTNADTRNWSYVQKLIEDGTPEGIMNDPRPLPMYGRMTDKQLSTTTTTRWGEVELTRSVASFDLFVERNDATQRFNLLWLLVAYAPDNGFPGELRGSDAENNYRDGITTGLHSQTTPNETLSMFADGVVTIGRNGETIYSDHSYLAKVYDAIAYKTYVYENPYTSIADDTKRATRLIVAGNYTPEGGVSATYFYPVDILDEDGNYRLIERNHKYEFVVTAVTGPGYTSFEDAKDGAMRNLNMTVLKWDKSKVAFGMKGDYYATMTDKRVKLERHAGSSETVELSYDILDGIYDEVKIKFKGSEGAATAGTISNAYFEVALEQDATLAGKAQFKVKARKAYDWVDAESYAATVVVEFRDLVFEFDIVQIDGTGWDDGGDIPVGEVPQVGFSIIWYNNYIEESLPVNPTVNIGSEQVTNLAFYLRDNGGDSLDPSYVSLIYDDRSDEGISMFLSENSVYLTMSEWDGAESRTVTFTVNCGPKGLQTVTVVQAAP